MHRKWRFIVESQRSAQNFLAFSSAIVVYCDIAVMLWCMTLWCYEPCVNQREKQDYAGNSGKAFFLIHTFPVGASNMVLIFTLLYIYVVLKISSFQFNFFQESGRWFRKKWRFSKCKNYGYELLRKNSRRTETMRKTPTGIVCKVLTVCSKIQWVFFAWF